jgi:uncharacterized protein (DUF305 family)
MTVPHGGGPDGGGPDGRGERASPPLPRWLVATLAGVAGFALVAIGGGLAVIFGVGGMHVPADNSVDAGFARDMTTHHGQAVQMAQVVRDRSTDPGMRLLAYDIETQQLGQMGQMRGWLQSWGLSEQTDRVPMSWMVELSPSGTASSGHAHQSGGTVTLGPNGLMPGMATPEEMDRLRSLSGPELDTYFLQLMIRHHQGGLPMARYAAENARLDYVRDFADRIGDAQAAEIVTMEQSLRERGGSPLPAP